MHKKLQRLLIYICIALSLSRCAQITPLTGGKKDITPPKYVSANPENASVNFTGKSIEIQFDEYIVLKDLANQLIVTPQGKELPEIEASGKKLSIKFNEALLPNTTYKLSFGNAIADLREGNAFSNFEYVFSTGSSIDSMTIKGRAIYADNKKIASQVLIGLYPSNANDSIVYKDKPLYIAKTDEAGNFQFSYLPNSTFKLIAIKDQNKNLQYDGAEEQIGFLNETINTSDSLKSTLMLFKEIPTKSFIKKTVSLEYGKALIIYNKGQNSIKEVLANGLIKFEQNTLKDSLYIYYNNIYDTLLSTIKYTDKITDTVLIKIPTKVNFEKQQKNNAIKYSLQTNFNNSLPFFDTPCFILNYPIEGKNIQENKITLYEIKDSLKLQKNFSLVKNAEPVTSFTINADLNPESKYRLTILKGALIDNHGRNNDSITYIFSTTTPEDYAQLNLKVFFPKKENYIVQLLNDKELVVRENHMELSLTSNSDKLIEYKNLLPGNYFVKVVEDTNKNKVFDTGNYSLHQQAESIFINSTPIKLLSGWEIEQEWKVN